MALRSIPESSPVGIGIVGTGFLAETRARCYAQARGGIARLVAVASRDPANAQSYAERFAVPAVCRDADELLARDDVELVELCVPNHLHRPMAERAAAAGKHVVCTKPLTAYVGQDLGDGAEEGAVAARDPRIMLEVATRDALAMVNASRSAGTRLFYGENWVYAPAIRRAGELLARTPGRILEMRGWEAHSGSHTPYSKSWKHTGGGALLRLGAHPIGAMLHLKNLEGERTTGQPIRVRSVTAQVADLTARRDLDDNNCTIVRDWAPVENWGCAILDFEDGSRGVVYGSDNVLGGMESKLELYSSDCHLKCNLSPNDMLQAYASREEAFGDAYLMEKLDRRSGWTTPMPNEDWTSGQLSMVEDFAHAVRENRGSPADGGLGLEVTRVVYSAYVSAREGKRIEIER